ncbi:MAG: DUF4886 domain-containing protein [Clostridia bacterium]|nr:DUF4886 domain-containing protein [Clostridia bacterium]
MNILSIGNSFSCDAQRYLHAIAKADTVELNTFNLFIGGCPLSLHYRNMLSEERAYELEMNGESTLFKVSLKEALLNRDWDVVTVQQVSNQSPFYETYQPYLNKIAEYVRLLVPKAKLVVHQTWSYEQGSYRLNTELGYSDQKDMFYDIKRAYKKAADDINADFIIPSGEVFEALISDGITKLHRDTFHASLGTGRYALGLIWYMCLTGHPIKDNSFASFDEEISSDEVQKAKKCVEKIYKKYL